MNSPSRLEVLGVPVDVVTMSESVDRIRGFLALDEFHLVVTVGTEMVMRAQHDPQFLKAVRGASLVVPDGVGVVWAARYAGYAMPEKVAGADLVKRLAVQLGPQLRLFLLGGAPGVAERAAQKLLKCSPGINIVGVRDGFFKSDEEVVQAIAASGANLVLAGLGFPRQELWLQTHGPRLGAAAGIGVGGTFDVLSGRLQRAPNWMIRLGLEWLYRLVRQPTRWGRMLALPKFAQKVLRGRRNVVRPAGPPE